MHSTKAVSPAGALSGAVPEALDLCEPDYVSYLSTDRAAASPPDPSPENRLTVLVPFDETMLNVGAHVISPNLGVDFAPGISGHTDHHIDFQALAGPKVTLTLGTPVTAAVELERDAVPKTVDGYGMATDARALHEAENQHFVVSTGGDVIVRAASDAFAVLQSERQTAELIAGRDVAIRANRWLYLGAGGPFETPTQGGEWAGRSGSWTAPLMGLYGALGPVTARYLGYAAANDQFALMAKKGMPGTEPGPLSTISAAIFSAASVLTRIGPGIHVHGRADVAASAGSWVGLWSGISTDVTGVLAAVVMGAATDVIGANAARVFAGAGASLVSQGGVEVSSTCGPVSCYAGTVLDCTSETVVAIEAPIAHASAEEAMVAHSERGTVFASSKSFAFAAEAKQLAIGSVGDGSELGRSALQGELAHVVVRKKEVVICAKDKKGKLTLSDKGAKLEGGSFVECKSNGNLHFKMKALAKLGAG